MTIWQVGIVVGLLASAGYLVKARRNGQSPALAGVINILVVSAAGAAAVRLGYLAWTASKEDFKPFGSDDRVYVFLGGLALLWVSSAEIYRQYRSVDRVAEPTTTAPALELEQLE